MYIIKRLFLLIFFNVIFYIKAFSDSSFVNNLSYKLINNKELQNANVSIKIVNLNNSLDVFSYQNNKNLVPASNLKILTTYLALKYLPENLEVFKYYISNDTLIIIPSADPTLFYKNFNSDKVYDFLKQKSFSHIVINISAWKEDKFGLGWSWDDYLDNYMVEKSIMPIFGNRIKFNLNAKNEIILYPNFLNNCIDFNNDENLKNKKDFIITREYNKNIFRLKKNNKEFDLLGNVKLFDSIEIPLIINNTSLLKYYLENTIKKSVSIINNDILNDKLFLSLYNSQKLQTLKTMLSESDNFIAEQLLLMISNKQLGYINVKKIIDSVIKDNFKDNENKFKWVDGSGLSRNNYISTNNIIFTLKKIYKEFNWNIIETIFPTADEGTLKDNFINYNKIIYAKTGSMSGVVALSGYFINKKSNNKFAFSIIINNFTNKSEIIKKLLELYLIELIESGEI